MTDNIKEALSAFMDNESSEIEVHRLLRHLDHADDIASWAKFQHIRSTARRQQTLLPEVHVELHRRLQQAIAAEDVLHEKVQAVRSYWKPVTSLAAAASVVAAVLVGVSVNQESPDLTRAGITEVLGTPAITTPVTGAYTTAVTDAYTTAVTDAFTTPVTDAVTTAVTALAARSSESRPGSYSVVPAKPTMGLVEELELRELSQAHLRKLRSLLNRHERLPRMDPNSRLVRSNKSK